MKYILTYIRSLLSLTNLHSHFFVPQSPASLELSRNGFTGEIPTEIGLLRELTTLELNGNELSGKIPAALGDLDELGTSHRFPGVSITATSLSTIKDTHIFSLPFCCHSESLKLEENLLTGRPPVELCDLRELSLTAFTTDCPTQDAGVLCPIGTCCTSCRVIPSSL